MSADDIDATYPDATYPDAEELFPPKPGGMVDRARQRAAEQQAQAAQAGQEPLTVPAGKVTVPVGARGAELARARTFSLSASGKNPLAELLGQDLARRSAVIMTLDEPVVIAFSQQAAQDPRNASNAAGLSANGFTLPVNVPVTVDTSSVIWCVATSDTATRVSVMAFSYTES